MSLSNGQRGGDRGGRKPFLPDNVVLSHSITFRVNLDTFEALSKLNTRPSIAAREIILAHLAKD